MSDKIPDDKVDLKVSSCQKCEGIVRVAVKQKMDTKSKNSFMKEVMKYNLKVSEQPLLEYREQSSDWCKCTGI